MVVIYATGGSKFRIHGSMVKESELYVQFYEQTFSETQNLRHDTPQMLWRYHQSIRIASKVRDTHIEVIARESDQDVMCA